MYGMCAGVFDPFFPSRSLSQVLNLMDQMLENPLVAASRGMGGGGRRDFDVREDSEGLYIRVDMPGLGKEDVKVTVEQDTLVIRGGGGEESEGEEEGRRYSSRIELPSKLYRTEEIKAEMKNGVLKILVPKVRAEERADVRRVSIE